LDLAIEPDLTVLFAENGGGKSATLAALAMGIAVFQPQSPKSLKFDAMRDLRRIPVGKGSQREPAGPCSMTWKAGGRGTRSPMGVGAQSGIQSPDRPHRRDI
jgi:hypothetical protein